MAPSRRACGMLCDSSVSFLSNPMEFHGIDPMGSHANLCYGISPMEADQALSSQAKTNLWNYIGNHASYLISSYGAPWYEFYGIQ